MSAATRTQVRDTGQQDSLPDVSMRTSSCTHPTTDTGSVK